MYRLPSPEPSTLPKKDFPIQVEFGRLPDKEGLIILTVALRSYSQEILSLHSIEVSEPEDALLSVQVKNNLVYPHSYTQRVNLAFIPKRSTATDNAFHNTHTLKIAICLERVKNLGHIGEIVLRFLFKSPYTSFMKRKLFARLYRLAAPGKNWMGAQESQIEETSSPAPEEISPIQDNENVLPDLETEEKNTNNPSP